MTGNNADLIVRMLKDAGITHGFGIPSGQVLPLIEAMRKGGIEFVLTAHEGSAGFAADAMARMTGTPGFCLSTLGPGATNLATGVGDAYLDRSPLIALTCNIPTHQFGRRVQMHIDHHTFFRPITKASYPLRSGQIASTVEEALRISLSEPFGPVHLDLPVDVSLEQTTEAPLPPPAGVPPPKAPEADLRKAAEILRGAKRPVAIIGMSAMRMKNPENLVRFLEKHQLPFATTTMAKGMVDEDHPLSLGCIERAMRQRQRKFLKEADLIVGLGYDTVEAEYEIWIGGTNLLSIDVDPVDADDTVQVTHQAVGDLDHAIVQLLSLDGGPNEWPAGAALQHKEAFQQALRPPSEGFAAHLAIDAVRAALPSDGVLSFDVGAHTHQITSQWTAHAPRTFLITNGWSSMGFGIPAAIGAKVARPDLPVVCILGDGCFQMTCGEVATAKRLGLPLPIVVLDDRWLSLIQIKQDHQDLQIYGTELQEEEYRDPPAHYFGVPVVCVRGPGELEQAVKKALGASGPTVIEAIINPAHYMETVFD